MVPVASSVWFDMANFQNELKTKHLGRSFIYRRARSSTMDLAAREFSEGAPHGTVVLAEEQSNPKARVEHRTWSSAPKGNIYMTYLVRSQSFLNAQHLAALALVQACHSTRIAERARVKWPNDVWVDGKKLSGNIARADTYADPAEPDHLWYCFQVGIGINVNEDMSLNESVKNVAVSLSQIASHPINRESFLARYLEEMERLLQTPAEEVLQLYRRHSLFQKGDTIMVHELGLEHPGQEAVVVGIDNHFQLLVDQPGVGSRTLNPQEVSVRSI